MFILAFKSVKSFFFFEKYTLVSFMKPSHSKLFYSSRKEFAHQYLQQNIACSMGEAYSGSTAGRATHAFEDTNFVVKALQYRRTRKVGRKEEHWKQIMKKIVQW